MTQLREILGASIKWFTSATREGPNRRTTSPLPGGGSKVKTTSNYREGEGGIKLFII